MRGSSNRPWIPCGPAARATGAVPLRGPCRAAAGAPPDLLRARVAEILAAAAGRPGHIFHLGHGIVPTTPVENVQAVVRMVREFRLEAGNG